MRKDMAKVIVERPRYGSSDKYRKRRNVLKEQIRYIEKTGDYEADKLETGTESIRYWASIMLGYDRKQLNEFLSPLKRFMLSRVGCVWDDVFSEICERISPNSACQLHIWQHAKDYVEERTFIGDDGEVWFADDYCYRWRDDYGSYRPIKDSGAVVYVDPCNGCLKIVPQDAKRRYRSAKYEGRVVIDEWNQAHRIGDHWFWIELAPIPQPYWKGWTETEKTNIQAEIVAARKSPYYFYSSDARGYRRSIAGRWIYPTFSDCALYSIIKTWRGETDDWKSSNRYLYGWSDYDYRSSEAVFGRKNVYAARRWQMNGAELRRYGIKPIKDFEGAAVPTLRETEDYGV